MRLILPTLSGQNLPSTLGMGRTVFGIDGSKYNLPATESLREAFDPESGLENSGKGHYPQCLVSTVYDVFRQLPVARTVTSIAEGNEREEAEAMLEALPLLPSLLLFDRGLSQLQAD